MTRRVYLDSRFRHSGTEGDFRVILQTPIELSEGALGYIDILTDVYVAYEFFRLGDIQFGAMMVTFLLLPALIIAFMSLFFIGARAACCRQGTSGCSLFGLQACPVCVLLLR